MVLRDIPKLTRESSCNGGVQVLLNGRFPCGCSVLFGQPLRVGADDLLRFLRADDGEMVLCAKRIGNPTHLSDITFRIAAVFFAVFYGHGVPHNVIVYAFGVQMRADHRLKIPMQQPIRKFQPDLMRQFRRRFSGCEALHEMKALHAFFLMPHGFDAAHVFKSRFASTAGGGSEQILLAFIFVERFMERTFQRFLARPAGTLFLIERIVDGVVEAVDGDNAGICYGAFLLSAF